jgi:hypothetical protein
MEISWDGWREQGPLVSQSASFTVRNHSGLPSEIAVMGNSGLRTKESGPPGSPGGPPAV